MPRVVLLKTGTTYPAIRDVFGDFDSWFVAGLAPELNLHVVDVTVDDLPGQPRDWDGIVVTGSPAMVSDRAPWSEQTARWLAEAVTAEIPVLGVCYGHQLLAHALGGEAGFHPAGRETGTHQVELLATAEHDPLFKGLPRQFPAQLTHRQSVLRLPENAILLGRNDFEAHQAFRVGPCAWGVQFHPEFSADIMRAYLEVQAPDLVKEGLDAGALLAGVRSAPEASSLLDRFSRIVMNP
ncbi:glutamine amidotransferase [Marinobacter orientalis]|uniref:Glutamine amidotransferase n=1 Tax=Marinobacter orientalis TaxID=1928859 RepID=A0A7Y0RDM4_9GAMM|nr:glutamine amidotransferase [Marinobacter orientalis]NMT64295.1 glutamine amidotransferase [Marinobacter orientalis]TGX49509.1 glutamine amidotransferase [Marinobacter orientalis]